MTRDRAFLVALVICAAVILFRGNVDPRAGAVARLRSACRTVGAAPCVLGRIESCRFGESEPMSGVHAVTAREFGASSSHVVQFDVSFGWIDRSSLRLEAPVDATGRLDCTVDVEDRL